MSVSLDLDAECQVRRLLVGTLFLIAVGVWSGSLTAHELGMTEVVATVSETEFQLDMTCDLDALLLGLGPDHSADVLRQRLLSLSGQEREVGLQRLRRLFERRVRARFEGDAAAFAVSFPGRSNLARQDGSPSSDADVFETLGVIARLEGVVPKDAKVFSFFASRAFGAVRLRVNGAAGEWLLSPGEDSPDFDLVEFFSRRPNIALQYGALGFRHILPRGMDHVAFVLGLFLLGSTFRELVWQVSAFTVGHTASLAFAILGAVRVPGNWVEPLIALSIVVIALETLLVSGRLVSGRSAVLDASSAAAPRAPRHRLGVVFLFGLLHGLGFAGVLAELGLPAGRLAVALLSFNLGVELGQISVLALAFLALGAFRKEPWYRQRVVFPASAALAIVGSIWFVQRVL